MTIKETFSDFITSRRADEDNEVSRIDALLTVKDYSQRRNNESQTQLFEDIADFVDTITHSNDRIILTASNEMLVLQKVRPELMKDEEEY